MATWFRLPVDKNLPWYRMRVVLSQATYTVEMTYNTRMDRWFLSILDATGAPILMGLPVLILRNLLSGYRTRPVPPGAFIAVDDSGRALEPALSSFLTDHGLIYIDPA